MNFRHRIIVIVVENMFLCLLIAIPGYKFAKQFETHKVKQELLAEYAEQRLKAIGDLWKQSYDLESISHYIIENTLEKTTREWKGSREDLIKNLQLMMNPQIEQLQKQSFQIHDQLDAQRYIIGEDLYQKFQVFTFNQHLIIMAKMLHDKKGVKELETQINSAKEDIFKYVDDL